MRISSPMKFVTERRILVATERTIVSSVTLFTICGSVSVCVASIWIGAYKDFDESKAEL
jgi:hypothetical protein